MVSRFFDLGREGRVKRLKFIYRIFFFFLRYCLFALCSLQREKIKKIISI